MRINLTLCHGVDILLLHMLLVAIKFHQSIYFDTLMCEWKSILIYILGYRHASKLSNVENS